MNKNQYKSIPGGSGQKKSINRRLTYIVTDRKGMEAAQKLGERHRVVWGLALVFFLASLAMGLKVLPVMDEDFSDIMYFFVVTLSTVGYGDIVVASEPAMIFMVFYSFFGLLLAASIIGILSVQSLHRREEKRLENESQLDSQHLGLFVEEDDDEADEQRGGNLGMCGGSMRQSFRMWCGQQHTGNHSVPRLVTAGWLTLTACFWLALLFACSTTCTLQRCALSWLCHLWKLRDWLN
jgi:hypothetical protein